MTAPPRGAQTLPDIISTAFTLVVRHRGRFLLLALPGSVLTTGASVLLALVAGNVDTKATNGGQATASFGTLMLLLAIGMIEVLTLFITDALVVPAAFEAMLGRRPNLQGAWLTFRSVFVALVVGWLIIAGSFLVMVVPVVTVPLALYFAVRWSFFIQELTRAPGSAVGAIRSSTVLVRGSWWRCFGIHLSILLISFLPGLAVEQIVVNVHVAVVDVLFTGLAALVAAPFAAVARTVLYADIKLRKGERLQDRTVAESERTMADVLMRAQIPGVEPVHRGKVRETFEVGDLGNRLLMVATDRISAFDVVMDQGIPGKGEILSRLSAFWFEKIEAVVPTHFIRVATGEPDDELPFSLPPELAGRSLIVRKAKRVDAECIVRGYLAGTGWAEYRETGAICGIRLMPGLEESQELPEPIFTPSTKEETGHDRNITYEEFAALVGREAANVIRLRSLATYRFAAEYARKRGLIIADTKFEFGHLDDELILIDEALTPDSSRFWPVEGYRPGRSQPSYDKQPLRDWLAARGWNKQPPPPTLPPEVVRDTATRYREAYRLLTGSEPG